MTEAVKEFMIEYLPKISGGGFALGGFLGTIAVLSGFGIKKALSLFDR